MSLISNNELFLLEEIVKKNFSSKYKDSILGIFWSVLKPLLIMIIFTIIFSTLFGKNIDNYPVYFLSAKCIFDFFNGAITVSMNSIKGNKSILQRTAAPKHIFVLGSVLSEFIDFIISLILLAIIMVVTNASFYFLIMPLALIPIIAALMMSVGLGLMLSVMCVYYTDIQHLWSVITLILMYSVALFYPISIVPEPYHSIMILNPLFWIVDQFRCIIYHGIIPQTTYLINSLLISIIILIFGILVFKKYEAGVIMKF